MQQVILRFKNFFQFQQGLAAAVLSGLLLWLSFNYHWLWPLSFIAITPLLYLIYEKELKLWHHILLGFVAGWIMAAGVMIWHWQILPVDWAGIENQLHGILLILYVWGLSSVMGGIIGLWSGSFYLLRRNNFFDILLAPALWVIFEYIRSVAISILWYGDGGLIGAHWSIAFAGYTLASSKLFLPLASLGGVYLLSFVVIVGNILVYFTWQLLKEKNNPKQVFNITAVCLLVVLIFSTSFYFLGNGDNFVKAAVVSTYVPSYSSQTDEQFVQSIQDKISILRRIENSGQAVDVITFPEDSRVLLGLQSLGQQQVIRDIFGQRAVLIVDSARAADPAKNEAPALKYFYLNNQTGELVESDKLFLVPHGEYLPYVTSGLLKLSGVQEWADGFRAARVSKRGENVRPAKFQDFKIGTVACSEVMSSSINNNMIKSGAAFIVNGASHSVFHGSKVLYDQMINMSKVRAAESNRYYIVAGNFIPSFVIDNKGQLIAETSWGQPDIIYEDIAVISQDSIYTRFGGSLLALVLSLIIGLAMAKRYIPKHLIPHLFKFFK